MDVVKERLQVEGQVGAGQGSSGSFAAFARIARTEGPSGLYRGFLVHQLTWAPFNGCSFMLYEKFKGWCINAGYEDGHDNLDPIAQVCSGAGAGAIAAALTNPLDVLKTRVQVARANPAMFPYTNAWQAVKHLLEREGAGALLDGMSARTMWLAPRLTIYIAAYERLGSWMLDLPGWAGVR